MLDRNADPVVAWYISEMKEINITVPYCHDCQERSIFRLFVLGLIILPLTPQPPNPEFLLGKKGHLGVTRSEEHY